MEWGAKENKLNTPGLTSGQKDYTGKSHRVNLSGTREASAIPDVHTPLKAQYLLILKAAAVNKKLIQGWERTDLQQPLLSPK